MIPEDFAKKTNAIVRRSGKLLESLMNDPAMRKAKMKADRTPVTPTDIKINEALIKDLRAFGYPIVSEELLPDTPPSNETPYFLVDPLDGTKYFSKGDPEFAICVSLILDGSPYYGAVYDPINSRLFWAQKGGGAFCEDQRIHSKKPGEALSIYCGELGKNLPTQKFIEKLNITKIVEKGSALKFCDIAMGEVDIYLRFGPSSEWDTAAAQILLEEAGCLLYRVDHLQTMNYGKPGYLNSGVVACHKDLMPKMIQFLKDFDKNDKTLSVDFLKEKVRLFCDERGWDPFHNAKDLAIGVVTEASELLELFRFQDPKKVAKIIADPQGKEAVGDELADVFFCLLRFCQLYGFDLSDCLIHKMKKNAKKYPHPFVNQSAHQKKS